MARERSRSPVAAVQSPLITWLQNHIAPHLTHGNAGRGDTPNLEPHGSLACSTISADGLRRAMQGLAPSPDSGGCTITQDEVGLVDRILLEECHRCAALAELRVAFKQAWTTMWHCEPESHTFHAWFFSALNSEVPAWPPVPGCELRGKATAAELEPLATKQIREWLPAKKRVPFEHRAILGNPTMLEVAVTTFADQAIQLATEIRDKWLSLFQVSIRGPRANPLRIMAQLSAADGDIQASVNLQLLGNLPPYVRPSNSNLAFNIHAPYVLELLSRFEHCGVELPEAGPFAARCWQLLLRYQTFFGENGGWHSALTPDALSSLVQEFGVSHELFASPLNCSLPGYCSVFEDIDMYFGSSGSFFQFVRPEGPLVTCGGSFECNPPFDDELFQRVVPLLLQALTLCKEPLSIALVMPDWKWCKALVAASTSHFCRARVDITGKHAYLSGMQHCCKRKDRMWKSDPAKKGKCLGGNWSSVVFLLQNDPWVALYPISAESLARHRASWELT